MATKAAAKQSFDLVRRFNRDVFNERDYDRLDEFQSADFVQHGPMWDRDIRGNEESFEMMRAFHGAFSDLHAHREFSVGDGEYVCTFYTYSGTHDGDFMGIPPTNREAEVPGIVINRIAEDGIEEAWVVVDFYGLFRQLGLVPPMDELRT